MTTSINQKIDDLLKQHPDLKNITPFIDANATTPYLKDESKYTRKLCESIEQAIEKCELRDGMTISFHHAFREGDKVINKVVETISKLGIKNLTLASSSLLSCNAALIPHIESGVITKIYTSGLRGKLADAISHGLMENPVHIHSHGGRVKLIQSGEINIDIAFLAVSTADEQGNANGVSGKSQCGADRKSVV